MPMSMTPASKINFFGINLLVNNIYIYKSNNKEIEKYLNKNKTSVLILNDAVIIIDVSL